MQKKMEQMKLVQADEHQTSMNYLKEHFIPFLFLQIFVSFIILCGLVQF